MAISLRRLDATGGIVVNNQVRVLVQRVPYNSGGAVSGPVTVQDSVTTLSNNAATVNVAHSNIDETFTVTLLPPSGGGTNPQNVEIIGQQSSRCVDVPGQATTNGTQLQLWDCHGGTNQRFTYTSSKQLTVYGNKCLDVSGGSTADGAAVVIGDCTGQTSQQWNLNADGTITGVPSGKCVDASGRGTANGTKIIIWSCNGGTNQKWSLGS